MKFEFNSIEEILTFALQVNRAAVVACGIHPDALAEHLGRVAGRADKIAAIKIYRAVTGKGLKDSKEAIERVPIFAKRVHTNVSLQHGCGDPNCCPEEHDDTPF